MGTFFNQGSGGASIKSAFASILADGTIDPGSSNVDSVSIGAFGVVTIDVTSAGFTQLPVGSVSWSTLLAGGANNPTIDCTAISPTILEVQITQDDAAAFAQAFNIIVLGL